MNVIVSPAKLFFSRLFSRRHVIIGSAVLITFLYQFGVAWMLRGQMEKGYSDFSCFYTGGKIVASGNGGNLYDLATQQRVEGAYTVRSNAAGFLPYPHAPLETLIFVPIVAFPYSTACWIWWWINLPLGYLVLYLLRSHIPRLNAHLELAVLGAGFFLPLLSAECQGQDSVLSLLLFTICFIHLASGRAWTAGAALALTTYKPQLALLMMAVLFVTSARRWRILAGFVQSCLALALLSIALVGWRACAAYPAFVRSFASGYDDLHSRTDMMPNLRGLMTALFSAHLSHSAFVLAVGAVSALFVLAAVWASWGKGGSAKGVQLQFALAVTVTVMVAYHGFLHDMVLLLLPLLLVWNWLEETGLHAWRRKLMAACLLLFFSLTFLSIQGKQGILVDACAAVVFFALLCWEGGCTKRQMESQV